jgi:hypothetical protein
MLEEWRCGDGIEVLDGWTFQVSRLFTNPITDFMSFFTVLIRVSLPIPRNDQDIQH